jgi:simple sugar transport system permease protein
MMNTSKNLTFKNTKLFQTINRLLSQNEAVLVISIVVMSILIGTINNKFFTIETVYGTLLATVIWGIVGMGVALVMINGGVDLSCMAIAMFSAYSATKLMLWIAPDAPIIVLFLIAMVIGAGLGLVNALFISIFNIPIFIATLALGVIYKAIMLEFIGNIYITPAQMPQSALDFSRTYVLGGLHVSVLIMFAVIFLTFFILRFTVIGRGVYALGGAPESAQRIGFNLRRLKFSIYVYAGIMYAIGGVVYVSNSRLADPYDMIGTELTVIAAVVLGGVSLLGGKGSVWGVLLGALLSVIIRNNLILIGISSDWANFVFGMIFIIAVALQAYNSARSKKQTA